MSISSVSPGPESHEIALSGGASEAEMRRLFTTAMRRFANGVSIIAAGTGLNRRGTTATAVASVSADPPHMLVCVNHSNSMYPAITGARSFSINILSSDQERLAQRFAGVFGHKDLARFEEGCWSDDAAPVLVDAPASLLCRLTDARDVATHRIFIGRVEKIRLAGDPPSLVYLDGGFLTAAPPKSGKPIDASLWDWG